MKTLLQSLLTVTCTVFVASFFYPAVNAAARRGKVHRHVVLFSFNEETTSEQIQAVERAFAEMPRKISSIVAYEWGTNVSPEGLADGFTHCFFVTFKDKAGVEEYLPHMAHLAFVELVKPRVGKVLVIDYVAQHSR